MSEVINQRYTLLRRLGQGGMGEVFLAADRQRPERLVALKYLSSDRGAAELLREEFRKMSRLNHPHLVQVLDLETDQQRGVPFIVMEYVEGSDFQLACTGRPMPQLVELAIQACRGLAYLHSQGIVHRDLKPENLIVSVPATGVGSPRLRILDLGLAHHSTPASGTAPQAIAAAGTLPYAAPEQFRGDWIDHRADLYSLGVLLYQALCGRLPFEAADPAALIQAHLAEEPPPPTRFRPELDAAVEAIVLRLLRKRPAERYQSAAQVEEALLRLAAGLRPEVPASAPRRAPPLIGREREIREIIQRVSSLVAVEAPEAALRLLLLGEAGSGKSRLADEARTLARSHGVEIRSVAAEDRTAAPFGLLLRIESALRAVSFLQQPSAPEAIAPGPAGSDAPPAPGPEGPEARAGLLWTAARAACRVSPVLLIIENLHEADRDSLAALGAFLRKDSPGRLLLLGTSRQPLAEIDAALASAWEDVPGSVAELAPLSEDEISLLLASFAGADSPEHAPEILQARASGNPLFALEWARTLLERGIVEVQGGAWVVHDHDAATVEAPGGLVELARVRLETLSAGARSVAAALAVFDRPARTDELVAVSGMSEAEVATAAQELDRLELLRVREAPDGPLELAHAALRAAVRSMAGGELPSLHARAAAWLERDGRAPASELAAHWREAEDPARAFSCALTAADEARDAGARHQQVRMLGWAIEAAGPERAAERARLLIRAATMRLEGLAWEQREADELFTAAELAARSSGDGRLLLEALLGRHNSLVRVGEMQAARELEPAIHARLERAPDPDLEARHAAVLAVLSAHEGNLDRAVELSRRAADLHLGRGRLAEAALCLSNAAAIQTWERDPEVCKALLDEAVSLMSRSGERHRLFFLRLNLALVAMCRGRWAEAEEEALSVLEHVRRAGFESWVPTVQVELANARAHAGALDAAISDFEAAARSARRLGRREVELYACERLGSLLRRLGLRERAEQVHEEALSAARALKLEGQMAFLGAALAEDLCEAGGDAARACALAAEALALAERIHHRRARFRALLASARARLSAGDAASAALSLDGARELTNPLYQHQECAQLETVEARAAVASGDAERAARAFTRGLEHAAKGSLHAAGAELLALRIDAAMSEDPNADLRGLQAALDALTARVSDPAIAHLARTSPAWREAAGRAAALAPPPAAPARDEARVSERSVLQALAEVGRDLETMEDPRRVAGALLERARALVGAERALLVLTDPNGDNARTAASSGLSAEDEPEALQFSRAALARGLEAPLLVLDTASDPGLSASRSVVQFGIRSILCAPLRLRGSLLGAIYLDSRARLLEAGADHLRFLEAFAHQAAAALDATRALDGLRAERERLRGRARERYRFHSLLGRSPAMQEIYDLLEPFSKSDLPVLITGESGTGKELVARALHWNSARREGPFVAESCAAIPENLLESEMFGHLRGAFTGAERDRRGMFVEASGGTLFLDEIGDMAAPLQAKLLRAVQEKQIRPLGGSRPVSIDVRIVAATHRDLPAMVREGSFREDLLYRLRVLTLRLPPLRERMEDLPLLARHFLAEQRREHGRGPADLAPDLLDRLGRHTWPGNVRELRSEVLKLAMVSEGARVERKDLEDHPELFASLLKPGKPLSRPQAGTLRDLERREMERALRAAGGDKLKAAGLLGLSRATLYRKLRRYRIAAPQGH